MGAAGFVKEMTLYLDEWGPEDIQEIDPLLLSYRPTRLNRPPNTLDEVLSDSPDPERLHPGAPNRAGVATNLDNSIEGFKREFPRFATVARDQCLADWRELVRLNIRHATEAERHFTNGHDLVTLVTLADGTRSLAAHSDLRDFLNDLVPQLSMTPERMAVMHSEADEVRTVRDWLSGYDKISVAVTRQGQPDTMQWRTWGSVPAFQGYRRRGLVLTLGCQRVWTELNEWSGAPSSPYAVLNTLGRFFPEARAETCGTCQHFAFSGMSADMSGDWNGYCLHQSSQVQARPNPVSVVDRCEHQDFVKDTEREHPYMAQKTTTLFHLFCQVFWFVTRQNK